MNDNLQLRHWGIRRKDGGGWIKFMDGQIFWTTSYAVAAVQLSQVENDDYEVAEFDPQSPPEEELK